ncbi:MAG: hypothetical protein ACFFE5_04460 [Candidatus Thorarchaeota archaeon]
MSHSELNQLNRAEQLFNTGNLDEFLEILNDLDQYEELDPQKRNFLAKLLYFTISNFTL